MIPLLLSIRKYLFFQPGCWSASSAFELRLFDWLAAKKNEVIEIPAWVDKKPIAAEILQLWFAIRMLARYCVPMREGNEIKRQYALL